MDSLKDEYKRDRDLLNRVDGKHTPLQCMIECNRELPNRVDGLYTPLECMAECKTKRFGYSGSQWEKECWCGNTYNNMVLPTGANAMRTTWVTG